MMDFMEIDEDLDSDPIKDFFKNKLEEIKLENAKLQETFNKIEEETRRVVDQRDGISSDISVETSWVKIANDKYAVWFLVTNKTQGFLEECRLVLSWNSSTPLQYTSSTYKMPSDKLGLNERFESIEVIGSNGYIVAVIDCADFVEKLCLEITGLFSCCDSKGQDFYVDIPHILIESRDLTNQEKIVPVYKLIEASIPDFFSWLVCSNKVTLIQKLSDPLRKLESVLEIDASLFRINLSTTDSRRFFLAHKASPSFDGCVLEIAKKNSNCIYKVRIYYRNQRSLISLIHHLYQNISSLILLPEDYEIHLHSKTPEECEELLRTSILKEVNFAKDFTRKRNSSKDDLKKFRQELNNLEHETDKAYVQLRIAKQKSESDNF